MKKVYLILTLLIISLISFTSKTLACQNCENIHVKEYSKYDYIYKNPPRQSIGVAGRYIIGTSNVRYVHSPSRLKGVRHAARIDAYNYQYQY